jgi:RimJ/RimL family protein N-acetyltransferase
MLLEGQSVRLRAYTRDDLPLARGFINNVEVGRMLREGILFPFRPEDEESWYNSLNANSTTVYSMAIETKDNGTYIGGCGVFDISAKNRTAMIGIFLGAEYCGKGYGADAFGTLLDFCFLELNLNKVSLSVFSINGRAICCYEKLGFVVEGVHRQELYRDGDYHDILRMGILRNEWEARRASGPGKA